MELIEYGPCKFNIIKTLRCDRRNVEDAQGSYLYTDWDILVQVNYQPTMAAYALPGGIFTPAVATPGTYPGQTDTATLVPLLQPRQLLRITAGNAVILETPALIQPGGKRFKCDARGDGPSVDMVGVPQMVGIKHWVVTLHIKAAARDRRQGTLDPKSAVISNLWVGSEDIDYQRRSVRHFSGRAILRADVMRAANINANSLRDFYLFKCPDHYKRQNVRVRLSEDGTTCDWSFDDVMLGYDLGIGSPIVKMECFRSGSVSRKSPLRFLLSLSQNIVRAGLSPPGLVAAGLWAGIDNLPVSYRQVRCDIIGDRNADIGALSAIALGVCNHHLGAQNALMLLTGTLEVTFRQDIADQVYTSVEMSTQFTDEGIILAAGQLVGALNLINRVNVPLPIPGFPGGNGINIPLPNFDIDGLRNWRDLVPPMARASALVTQQLTASFTQDSRNVQYSAPQFPAVQMPAVPAPDPAAWDRIPPVEEPAPPQVRNFIVASREGEQIGEANPEQGWIFPGLNDNPALRRGAYGVEPQENPGPVNIPDTPRTQADADPVGGIPNGIEHLIVQAILGVGFELGQNQSPPLPIGLITDS